MTVDELPAVVTYADLVDAQNAFNMATDLEYKLARDRLNAIAERLGLHGTQAAIREDRRRLIEMLKRRGQLAACEMIDCDTPPA